MIYNSVDGGIKIAVFNSDNSKFESQNFYSSFVLSSSQDPNCKDPNTVDILSIPHSAAYLDLDGDCMADIFLTKQHLN